MENLVDKFEQTLLAFDRIAAEELFRQAGKANGS